MGVQRRRRLVLLRRPGGDRDGGHQVRPVAGLAVSLFGGNSLIWLEIFVLGLLAMAVPLVLLAWLPLKAGSSLLGSMQNVVKRSPGPRAARRKRP